jgi:hypothetical protein
MLDAFESLFCFVLFCFLFNPWKECAKLGASLTEGLRVKLAIPRANEASKVDSRLTSFEMTHPDDLEMRHTSKEFHR